MRGAAAASSRALRIASSNCFETASEKLVGRSLDDPLELVELAALDVGEAGLDALDRLGFLGRDAFAQLALALAQPLGHLVQRAAPVALVRLELLLRRLGELVDGARELGLERGQPLALFLAGGVEPLRVELAVATRPRPSAARWRCAQRGELRGEAALGALEVGVQLGDPVRDALLDLGERLAELRAGGVFPLGEGSAARLADLALLRDELRERVGAGARERPLELGGAGVDLGRDERVEAVFRLGEPAVDLAGLRDQAPQNDDAELERRADGDPACRDGDLARGLQRERRPRRRRPRRRGTSRAQTDVCRETRSKTAATAEAKTTTTAPAKTSSRTSARTRGMLRQPEHQQRGREGDVRGRESPQRALGRGRQRLARDRLAAAVS